MSGKPQELCSLIDACLSPGAAAQPTVAELMARLELIGAVPDRERRDQPSS